MKHIMIDLETLSTNSNASIISIGAVEFDVESSSITSEFYEVIKPSDWSMDGFDVNGDTIAWWLNQSIEARKAIIESEKISLADALHKFTWYLHPYESFCVWGNGSDFDITILTHAYRQLSMDIPWKFYNTRCYRTIKSLYPETSIHREGTYHNALSDACSQARHLIDICNKHNIILK